MIGGRKNIAFIRLQKKIIFLAFSFTIIFQLSAQTLVSREYNIKAVFLYNFTQFIDWPPASFNLPESPFVIGILGEDPFHTYIDQTVSGEKVNGHSIRVQRYDNIQDVKNCHILFVSHKESGKLKNILAAVKNRNVLTVSDMPGFAVKGGMISFITRDNKIKLQVNPAAARAAGLNISSKLLRISEIVGI